MNNQTNKCSTECKNRLDKLENAIAELERYIRTTITDLNVIHLYEALNVINEVKSANKE